MQLFSRVNKCHERLFINSDLGPASNPRVRVSSARRLLGKRVQGVNYSGSLCFSFTANKMPAVHHKLLLEEALQDSPQVGPCGVLSRFKDTTVKR